MCTYQTARCLWTQPCPPGFPRSCLPLAAPLGEALLCYVGTHGSVLPACARIQVAYAEEALNPVTYFCSGLPEIFVLYSCVIRKYACLDWMPYATCLTNKIQTHSSLHHPLSACTCINRNRARQPELSRVKRERSRPLHKKTEEKNSAHMHDAK